MHRVLIIDDDPVVCETLSDLAEQNGYAAASALTLARGLEEAAGGGYDIVLLDVHMPDGNGIEALPAIRRGPSAPVVIVLTGFGDPDGAEAAIRSGAWDYIEKPSSEEDMVHTLSRAIRHREETRSTGKAIDPKREGIIGGSTAMRACLEILAKAAESDASVLITGETGTGKELIASAIHRNSARAQRHFIVVDCTALPETLVESMLFGHEKGAFTGADAAREGMIRQADGGTLFLDEVGELPLTVQKRFLRVLQNRRFRPLGSKKEVVSDFRLVSATNRNLDQMAAEGLFRQDLLYRIRAITIDLPPLRDHAEDIPEICHHHMGRFCRQNGMEAKTPSTEFLDALAGYEWPGNVRELVQALESAISIAREEEILLPQHLPVSLRARLARKSVRAHTAVDEPAQVSEEMTAVAETPLQDWWTFRIAAERDYIRRLMVQAAGDIETACRIAKLSRARIYQLLKKHGQ